VDYDVLILGGGIVGCAAAYELSKYSLNIALIEKNYDVADDVALINSTIVYDGCESNNSLTMKLEQMGNQLLDEVTEKFNVPFSRCGSLYIAANEEEQIRVEDMYEKALKGGVQNLYLLSGDEARKLEPNLPKEVIKALYSKNAGTICPYDLALSYAEVAFDNGVNFKLEEEVVDIQRLTRGFRVITNKNKFTCKLVLNTTPGKNYSIDNNNKEVPEEAQLNLNYFVLDKDFKGDFQHVIFSVKDEDEKIYTLPTLQGSTIAAISSRKKMNHFETLDKISYLLKELEENDVNNFFQTPYYKEPIIIDDSFIDIGYIKVTGKHYAQVTMTPAIASIVCETIISNMNCKLKKHFIDKRREYFKFSDMSDEERKKVIEVDKKYGNIICACHNITEGEIVDAIRRPLGARTVEGIKRRTGVTMGACQGSYCLNKIISILARETDKSYTDVVKDSKNSKMVLNRIKEFDGV